MPMRPRPRTSSPIRHYDATIEGAMTVTVVAYDWNCPQHITPRYTLAELEVVAGPLRQRLQDVPNQETCGLRGLQP